VGGVSEYGCLVGCDAAAYFAAVLIFRPSVLRLCLQFRHQVTTLVLATDMSLHFESLSKFQTQMVTKLDKGCARIEVLGNDKGMEMAIQMALKTADIGHCAMRLGSHIYWVAKLEVEFFRQGDLERKAGHPISPLMDREKTGTTHPSNQVRRIDGDNKSFRQPWQGISVVGGSESDHTYAPYICTIIFYIGRSFSATAAKPLSQHAVTEFRQLVRSSSAVMTLFDGTSF
jgi:hypothetical protein